MAVRKMGRQTRAKAHGSGRVLLPNWVVLFAVLILLLSGKAMCDTDPLDCSDDDDNDGIISTPGVPVCSEEDRNALLQFKASISSDPNNVLADWQASRTNCCDWTGVTCDGSTGRVVRLKLPNQDLQGTLSPDLSALSSLQVLILDNNDFSGTIPSSFGNLTSLQRLCLSNIPSLSGPIPDSFGQLSSLQLMDLRSDALTGPLPSSFGEMTSLRNLHLYGNQISGPIPESFGLLSQLYNADLGHNQISGRIADGFAFGLGSLINLYLNNNKITGLPDNLSNLTSLQWLDLSNNPLESGDAVKGIATAPLISQIELESCGISGPFPAWVSILPQPDITQISDEVTPSLDLANNAISGAIPAALGNLTNLQYLDLQNNQLNGSIPTSFAQLQSLQGFNVSYNQLSGEIPQVSPFITFDKSSYTPGNSGLCGLPLAPCA
ncbi:hypothetical protein KP509_11G003900 [Ceratopteris richardii]|uniref:Leucine-rich repeat-containing N-terminal plant-type domain-containing protein n=3 Tax=Ceratopteris richardii TaxID=49495 RepID=A0A8T2TPS9_CERRI|nr:hypothetical protein KP509_11G003900 [Ceratopteris richardii]